VRLGTSRILAPVDERPVWSIVCLFVAKTQRRQGLSTAMIEGATEYAELHGADVVEAYPVEPKGGTVPAAFAWWGLTGAYLAAGFQEVARRSDSRPIVRRVLG
jgi:GNAT superfamily N-acetyltransferase